MHLSARHPQALNTCMLSTRGGGGGDTPIYGLYRYVPPKRGWFLRFPILNLIGYHFSPFGNEFLVYSFNR